MADEAEAEAEGPAIDFEAWCALSARRVKQPREAQQAVLDEAGVDAAAWTAADAHWSRILRDDLREGKLDRSQRYGAACSAELERRSKALAAPAAEAPPPEAAAAPPVPEMSAAWLSNQASAAAPESAASPAPEVTPPPAPAPPAPAPAPQGTMIFPAFELPRASLPFGGQPSPEFLEFLAASPAAPKHAPGSTGTVELPGGGAPVARREPGPIRGLTLHQYASLCAELLVYPEQAAAILPKYGVPDEAARRGLTEAWSEALRADGELRQAWMSLSTQYREWLVRKKAARG